MACARQAARRASRAAWLRRSARTRDNARGVAGDVEEGRVLHAEERPAQIEIECAVQILGGHVGQRRHAAHPPPALLRTASSRPNVWTVLATSCSTASASVTSNVT